MARLRFIHAVIAVLVLVTPARAVDNVNVYSDGAMTSCHLVDNVLGLVTVFVGHSTVSGSTASQFRVPTPACWTGSTYIATNPMPGFSIAGDANEDLIVTYGGCYVGQFPIATISYVTAGQGGSCCPLRVVKSPTAPLDGVVVLDCALAPQLATALVPLLINPDHSCLCISPVRMSTWGGIKALYSDP